MSKFFFSQRSLKFVFAAMLGCICTIPSGNVWAAGRSATVYDQPVSGTVKDASGTALSGATVTIKGTGKSTSTDASGAFSLSVPGSSSVLVISYIGFEPQEITVG